MFKISSRDGQRLAGAFLVALGMVLAGGLVGYGIHDSRMQDRYVTVKGVAERDVIADQAFWPIRFVVADNDLVKAKAHLGRDQEAVVAFLTLHGINRDQISVQQLQVDDADAQQYRSNPAPNRFVLTLTLMVRSDAPETIENAAQSVSDLVDAGVVLQSYSGPSYVFSGLNDLKPEMIAEATHEARRAAEQFAKDADSSLAGIRRANQGVFQILARDPIPGVSANEQVYKKVRVVSTLEFLLSR